MKHVFRSVALLVGILGSLLIVGGVLLIAALLATAIINPRWVVEWFDEMLMIRGIAAILLGFMCLGAFFLFKDDDDGGGGNRVDKDREE